LEAFDEWLGRDETPTVTKPLRKVTQIQGQHYEDCETDCILCDDWRNGTVSGMLPMPCTVCIESDKGPMFAYRITVEAIPAIPK
jgi:hypothetical protein